jgi:hypothetical protein
LMSGSSMRDGTSTGRMPTRRAFSAVRAERFAERTEEKVAMARMRVPPAVARDEMVVQSAMSEI